MSSIPLVALDVQPSQARPVDPIQGAEAFQQARLGKTQQGLQDIALRQQQLQLQDQETLRNLMPQYVKQDNGKPAGYDFDGLIQAAQGKVMPETLFKLQQQQSTMRQAAATATKDEMANQLALNNQLYQKSEGVKAITDPQQRQREYENLLHYAMQNHVDVSGWQPQVPSNDVITAHQAELGMHAQTLADQKSQAEALEAAGKGKQAEVEAQKSQAEMEFYKNQGLAPGVTPEMAGYADFIKKGGIPSQYKAWQAQQEAKATLPSKIQLAGAEAEARQRAAQGDPNIAGQMLAKGELTLADLKSRGTTPQFITAAVTAAQKSKADYNPADEVIAEQVAKSPAANQFFGSANSLISKGGTLDQLRELGKQIPQHDFPVLNTIDDWQKLARGKGPLAAYAATALGVADDYAKVMGGGVGSDTGRMQGLNLFAKAASPEQRAQATAATRAAVLSQRDSRIGKNQFLKRQYAAELGGEGEPITVNTPKGAYTFKDQASADAFKKAAGIP